MRGMEGLRFFLASSGGTVNTVFTIKTAKITSKPYQNLHSRNQIDGSVRWERRLFHVGENLLQKGKATPFRFEFSIQLSFKAFFEDWAKARAWLEAP